MKRAWLILALAWAGCDSADPPIRDGGTDDRMGEDERVVDNCEPDERLCMLVGRMRCTPVQSNPLNCGDCGVECDPTETCDDGRCRPASSCDRGQTDCGGDIGCTDTDTNNDACGNCSTRCEDGEVCTRGACTPSECEDPTPDRCNDVCVDTNNDRANCGSCNTECGDGESCRDGACVAGCGGTVCRIDDGEQCIDTQNDPMNCGDCERACDTGQACVAGRCECGGETCGDVCTDVATDANNCGACDAPCDPGATCEAGRCVCPSGTEECRGACVNTQLDVANCGDCGNACPGGQTCVAGTCTATTCAGALVECGGTCTDVNLDSNNCGECGTICADGTLCDGGICRPGNDLRANAQVIELPANGGSVSLTGTTAGATTDVPSGVECDSGGPNIWYRIDPPSEGALWIDTANSAYDTSVFLTNVDGVPIAGQCNDDCPCREEPFNDDDFSDFQSCLGAYLVGGTVYLSVGGFSIRSVGSFNLNLQFLPADASFFYDVPLSGEGVTSLDVLIGPNDRESDGCGGPLTSRSGEDLRWFAACGTGQDHSFSVCPTDGGSWSAENFDGDAYDPVIYRVSGATGEQENCSDFTFNPFNNCRPVGGGPNSGARISNEDDLRRGVHGIYVDSAGPGGDGMFYELAYELPVLDFSDD
ncbi:MAG: hypothetical protein AAF411_11855 [Myxococcota bacterium]